MGNQHCLRSTFFFLEIFGHEFGLEAVFESGLEKS